MIRVFVGCAANGEDAESQAVLEYTLRRHASEEVSITWMRLSRDPTSPFFSSDGAGWQTELWSTPFSGFRWAVPQLCDFAGRAIYTDSDVIYQADVAELLHQTMQQGKVVLAKGGRDSWRFCVSVWDCAAARSRLPPVSQIMIDRRGHEKLVKAFRGATWVQPFRGNWNCIDGEDLKDLATAEAIHYSSEAHQPQIRHALLRMAESGRRHWFDGTVKRHWREDLIELFDATLEEAVAHGYDPDMYEPEVFYGPYRKKSHAQGYASNRWAPPHAR